MKKIYALAAMFVIANTLVTGNTACAATVHENQTKKEELAEFMLYTPAQRETLEIYFNKFLDNIQPDGSVKVLIPKSSGVDGRDLVQYLTGYNLGEVSETQSYIFTSYSEYTTITGITPADLKQQNETVTAKLKEMTEGMEPTLESAKAIYQKMSEAFTYEIHDPCGVSLLLERRTGKCNEFATMYAELLTQIGIENYYVEGYCRVGNIEGLHNWNIAVIDGKVYAIDVTHGVSYESSGKYIWGGFQESTNGGAVAENYRVTKIY